MLNLAEVKFALAAYAAIEPRLSELAKYHSSKVHVPEYGYEFKHIEPTEGGVEVYMEYGYGAADFEDRYHYALTAEELVALEPVYEAYVAAEVARKEAEVVQRAVAAERARVQAIENQRIWDAERLAREEATERKVLAQLKAKYEGKV